MPRRRAVDPHSVFLNVPFDASYQRVFVALIAALVSLGRVPRCVLEVPDSGQGRMPRIIELISKCRVSVHDLSRVGVPVRFNMPFELGIAYMLCHRVGNHDFIVLEAKEHRFDKTLSDLKSIDPKIHHRSPMLTISAIYDALGRPLPLGNPSVKVPEKMFRKLWAQINHIKGRRKTIFHRRPFNELILRAIDLAKQENVIH